MPTHSGHGSVTALILNTTQAKAVSQCARVMIRRITGSAALGKEQLDTAAVCKQCDHPAGSPESLERHSTRCANGGQRHYMHAGLVALIVIIMLMASVPKSSIVLEKEGLRPRTPGNRTRPGDIVVLNFYGWGRHLVIDVVLCTVYRNVTLAETCSIPGYAAKMAEDRKFYNDKKSSHPVSSKYGAGGSCVCPLSDGGWWHIGCSCLGAPGAVGGVCCVAWLLLLSGQPCPSHSPNAGFTLGEALAAPPVHLAP